MFIVKWGAPDGQLPHPTATSMCCTVCATHYYTAVTTDEKKEVMYMYCVAQFCVTVVN